MRILVPSVLLTLLLLGFSYRWKIGDTELPSLGSFFSVSQGFWQNAESESHFKDFTLSHSSLESPLTIVFDDRLVPHIWGDNDHDIAFAQGYVQAMLRLWQMDISYRDIAGRLAEVIGPRALQRDVQTRREGFGWAIDKALEKYSKDLATMAVLQAYTDGVNAYIESLNAAKLPLEYKLLGYRPELWTIKHSVACSKSMSRVLTMSNADIAYDGLHSLLGKELFDFLFPVFMEPTVPVHPGPWTHLSPPEFQDIEAVEVESGDVYIETSNHQDGYNESHFASNNWAVAGSKTSSGNPILCNDPHLGLSLPSVWFESHLISPEFNVYGVSLLGLPSIIIGFNEYIAWGLTNGSIDALDWLKVDWKDGSRKAYKYEGDWLEADYRTERIGVKGQEDHTEYVPYTRWGPVARIDTSAAMNDLAMRWTAHDVNREDELRVFLELAKGKSYQDYDEAMRKFPAPTQNIVFASRDGDIAIRTQGYWPKRYNHSGRMIAPASSQWASWQDYLSHEEIPVTLNPDRDYVSSANQEVVGKDYPFIFFGGFENYRGRILNRYLDEGDKWSVEDMMGLQFSSLSLHAEEGLPALLGLLEKAPLNAPQQEAVSQLEDWNYVYEASWWQPALFDLWINETAKQTFDETLNPSNPSWTKMPDRWKLIEMLLFFPEHILFDVQDTPGKEVASDIVMLAFQKAWEQLVTYGSDPFGISWNQVMAPKIFHLANIEAFSLPIDVGGAAKALNAQTHRHGPSWRQIVELTPTGPKAYGVYPGGQSGNPGSKYYDDSVPVWSIGSYHELTLYRQPEDMEKVVCKASFLPRK
jgi:penicillin amidase